MPSMRGWRTCRHINIITGVKIMYCSKCGTKVSDTSRFCNQCGEPITASVNPVIQKVMQGTPEQIQHFRNVLHEIVEGDNTA